MSEFKFEHTLTGCQENTIKKTKEWFNSKKRKPIFIIDGSAGTGKTSIIKLITHELNIYEKTAFISFTGKASLVLKQKGLENSSTIHRLIYIPLIDEETGKVTFRLKKKYDLNHIKLIVADECSMISQDLLYDLLSFDIPLLFLGDSNQLPPIGFSESIFDKPNVRLTEITRQALDNPIIRLSQDIIKGNKIKASNYKDNNLLRIVSSVPDSVLLKADQIICNTNKKKFNLNKYIRKLKGFSPEFVQVGDKVICRKNNWELSEKDNILGDDLFMLNGLQFNVSSEIKHSEISYFDSVLKKNRYEDVYESDLEAIGFDSEFKKVKYSYEALQTGNTEYRRIYNFKVNCITYAYALNTHVTQGSEFDNVVYFADDAFGDKELQKKLLYTGVTRAKNKLIFVQ